jgi:hypothetical protein
MYGAGRGPASALSFRRYIKLRWAYQDCHFF